MTRKIKVEVDTVLPGSTPGLCTELEVELYIECRDSDGADATFNIEYIECLATGAEVELTALEARDQAKIEQACQSCADEYGHEAYSEYAQGQADWAYDNYMDRLSDEASES